MGADGRLFPRGSPFSRASPSPPRTVTVPCGVTQVSEARRFPPTAACPCPLPADTAYPPGRSLSSPPPAASARLGGPTSQALGHSRQHLWSRASWVPVLGFWTLSRAPSSFARPGAHGGPLVAPPQPSLRPWTLSTTPCPWAPGRLSWFGSPVYPEGQLCATCLG